MSKCLITKLNSAVNDSSLLRLSETRVKYSKVQNPTDATQGISIAVSGKTDIQIVGDGYFTDKTLTEVKGTKLTLEEGSTNVFVSNNDLEVAILNKHHLSKIATDYDGQTTAIFGANKAIDLDSLNYSAKLSDLRINDTFTSGDIICFKNLITLVDLRINNTKIKGDVSSIGNLINLTVLNLGETKITGDISGIRNLSKLTYLNLANTDISGDISSLKNLTALTSATLGGKNILYGDISALGALANLEDINFLYSVLSGDLAKLPAKCKIIIMQNDMGSSFTWSTRTPSSRIIALSDSVKIDKVDKMLQDQAQCQVGFSPNDAVVFKTISVTGTRTSASDDAVAALQAKGYTVSITPE